MVIKVVKKYQTTIRCTICFEDYYDATSRPNINNDDNDNNNGNDTTTEPPPSISPILCAPDGCNHYICQPCLEKYTLSAIKRANSEGITELVFVDCPVPDCQETYLVEEIIALALPLKYRMLFWWLNKMQVMQHHLERSVQENEDRQRRQRERKRFSDRMKKRASSNSTAPTSSATTLAAVAAAAAASPLSSSAFFFDEDNEKRSQQEIKNKKESEKLIKMALSKHWTRCPRCKYLVQRSVSSSSSFFLLLYMSNLVLI